MTSVRESVKFYLKLLRLSLVYNCKEFFTHSTLHGVKYIVEPGRSLLERFLWFLVTTAGIISALVIIASLWEKFQTNPTITSLDTNFQNTKIVFPTILVCPQEPFDDEGITTAASNLLGYREEFDKNQLEDVLRQLPLLSYETIREFYSIVSNSSVPTEELNLRELLFLIRIKCEDVFDSCIFKGTDIECCEMFKPILTERGFCYAFNPKFIYSDKDNEKLELNSDLSDLFETDKKWSLTIYPKTTSNIFIHSQAEISSLEMASPPVLWNTDHSVDVLISIKETVTTPDTLQLSIGQRKCIFPGEIKLDFFPGHEYTFSSCMIECRMKLSLRFCHCVLPFYARTTLEASPLSGESKPDISFSYCRLADFPCLIEHLANITNVQGCERCELSCHNVVYEIEKLSKLDASEVDDGDGPYFNVEYLSWPLIRYKREVLFGWVDLLVSFGGIAGFFLGFSLLSGVEIIYFFTLRAFCMVYNEEDVLLDIDKKEKEKPMEEFYLGFKLKRPKDTKSKTHLKKHSSSKLMIFEGKTKHQDMKIKGPIQPQLYSSRALEKVVATSGPFSQSRTRKIQVRSRPEDIPTFPYLP